jgi:hypothetical protein
VRLKGIPEGGLKALKKKGYMSLRGAKRRGNLITPSLSLFPPPAGLIKDYLLWPGSFSGYLPGFINILISIFLLDQVKKISPFIGQFISIPIIFY